MGEEVSDLESSMREKMHHEQADIDDSRDKLKTMAPGYLKTKEEKNLQEHEKKLREFTADEAAIENYEHNREEAGEAALTDVMAASQVTTDYNGEMHAQAPTDKLEHMHTDKIEDVVNAFDDAIDKSHEKVEELEDEDSSTDTQRKIEGEIKHGKELEAERDAVDEYRAKRHHKAEGTAKIIEDKMHMSGG